MGERDSGTTTRTSRGALVGGFAPLGAAGSRSQLRRWPRRTPHWNSFSSDLFGSREHSGFRQQDNSRATGSLCYDQLDGEKGSLSDTRISKRLVQSHKQFSSSGLGVALPLPALGPRKLRDFGSP